jgi:DNA processing protein
MVSDARVLALLRWMSVGGEAAQLNELERSFALPLEQLLQETVTGPPRLAAAASSAARAQAEEWLERCRFLGINVDLCTHVPEFAALPEPPLLIFSRGNIGVAPRLAVVGSRAASAHGVRNTRRLCSAVASAGVPIVSGLARGIDAAAHQAALDAGGVTVAVLGCGLDECYPPEHERLLEHILEQGGVVSEWPPGTPPLPHHFPRRNRLLVALGTALLLVESRLRSGSFTSVRWAADLGKEVLVLPGPADALQTEGPMQLLREGATAVSEPDHILEALGLGIVGAAPITGERLSALTALQQRVLALLGGEALDLDALVRGTCEPPGSVLCAVLNLEHAGLVARDDWGAFSACAKSEQGAVVDAPAQDEVDGDGGQHKNRESLQSVAQPDAQGLREILAAGDRCDQVHHDEQRQEEQQGVDEAHALGSASAAALDDLAKS